MANKSKLTHLDGRGAARMVDISSKKKTFRWARAEGRVLLNQKTLRELKGGRVPKGDVWALGRASGILAAKRVDEFVPLAHPVDLVQCQVEFYFEKRGVRIESVVKSSGATGVELEALMAVWGASLTLYDMIKALQKDAVITDIALLEKGGGKSGLFQRNELGKK